MYQITDTIDNITTYAQDRDDLADKLRGMFDTGEDGIEDAIEAVADGIGREYIGAEEAFLGVRVHIVAER